MLSRIIAAQRASNFIPTQSLLGQGARMLTLSTPLEQMKGEIYRKHPVTMVMEKGKTYNWCACGLSKKQPLCDGSHKRSPKGISPIKFSPDATKEYTLCQCKQTNKSPFCDGTHSRSK